MMNELAEYEVQRNRFTNNEKALAIGSRFWHETTQAGLAGIVADLGADGYFSTKENHRFINLSCCSYLDFDSHPHIIQGAVAALQKYRVMDHCISRVRVQMPALLELEDSLGALFGAKVTTAISASAASAGTLPLIASGHLSGGVRPVMVFDKHAHFSMNLYKATCADETEVVTIAHNDMNALEDLCKKHQHVAYVCDGTYSMGGFAPVADLLALQEKYGLFLYFDDSHGLSILGKHGEGFIRSAMDRIHPRTVIVATLNKAFGASGAAIMFGENSHDNALLLERFGGPMAWSQPMNTAAIGGCLAAAELHRSPELAERQQRLQANIELFDSLVETDQRGNPFPIRLVKASHEHVLAAGVALYRAGFYVSPVFFPIVAKDKAGLRVMLRAGLSESQVRMLCQQILGQRLF
jgi:7-keto-8-aminopelargonate synthetase-like enzyme